MATKILGIESSCDECSASVVEYTDRSLQVRSVATFSQIQLHRPYGGVVPEIASRNHLESINPMIEAALEQAKLHPRELDGIAVTNRPGLVGALLVGVSAAKALAYAWKKPLIPVHHLEGHATSIFLNSPGKPERDRRSVPWPMCIAIVSGGHTNLYIAPHAPETWPTDFLKRSLVGRSRDDAAGEAFDKTAKILGFPYPGGRWIDETAQGGDPRAFDLPRALPQKSTLDFSFSGLKTAVSLIAADLEQRGTLEAQLPNLCASLQQAIIDALIAKITLAIREHGCRSLAVVGGVAANSRLRSWLQDDWRKLGLAHAPFVPESDYCTDNAAMIAGAGAFRFVQGHVAGAADALTLNAFASPEI